MLGERELLAIVSEASEAELRLSLAAGWIVPARQEGEMRFDETDAARLRLIHELRRDLGLDDEALPVVLSLIDQLHEIRFRFDCLAKAIAEEPEDVRERLLSKLLADFERGSKPWPL